MLKMDESLLDVGGYNDAIFLNLSKRQRLEYTCCICRFILNKPQQCSNGHLFCLSCIKEWTRRGNNMCPSCNVKAIYKENSTLRNHIDSKYVRCEASLCSWKGRLERLVHHVNEAHISSPHSSLNTGRETTTEEDRIGFHKTTKEVDRIHHWKKEVLLRRIKKMEKHKRNELLEKETAHTMPPDSYPSRSENFRPYTDGIEENQLKLPHVQWRQPNINTANIYQRLQDIERAKQIRRELTHKKIEQIEKRKHNDRDNLFRKVRDLEKKREETRQLSEQRIVQIEKHMKEEKDAFYKRIAEKERKNKDVHDSFQRHVSVIKVKMKK